MEKQGFQKQYDVIVAGGGPAGIMAALAAAKTGASVLLFERNGFLGGAATNSVLGPISPFMFGDEQVIDGIPQDFVNELMRVHGSTGHMKVLDAYGSGAYLGFYDREKYKYVAEEMLLAAGVDIFFHTLLQGLSMQRQTITGCTLWSKSGAYSFACKVMVDATGDGDVAVMAGEGFVYGNAQTGKAQPGSGMFEMVNVDVDKVYQYIYEHPDDFEWKSDIIPVRPYSERLQQHYFVAQGFKALVAKAVQAGDLSFGRDSVIVLNGLHPGSIHFNATRVHGYDASNAVEKSFSEIDGRRQIESVSEFMIKYVPGFENAYVSDTSNEVGVRESRHINGLYTLTADDAYYGRKFEDVVSRGYFPMDIHNPDGASGYTEGAQGGSWVDLQDTYDIPARCLLPATINGLVLSGRCISGTSEAHGSYRTQGGIMGIGQASGVMAGLAALQNVAPCQLDIKQVQATLISYGASVFRDEAKKAKQEAHALQCVRAYMQGRTKSITKKEILDSYMN